MSEIVLSPRAPEALGPYPHARRVGNLLFISGMGPRRRGEKGVPGVELDAQGRVVRYDIEAQCRAVFENVRVILEDAGSSWERLVDVTVFLTDLERDFATYNRLYGEYFGKVQPCRTTVGVAKLPGPIAIELKCIATLP
jgi:2-aminomuconate deaminase